MPERMAATDGTAANNSTKRRSASFVAPITVHTCLVITCKQAVDFCRLTIQSLRAYKRHHNLRIRANATKQELAEAVTRHFSQLPVDAVDEERIIEGFVRAVKTGDHSNSNGSCSLFLYVLPACLGSDTDDSAAITATTGRAASGKSKKPRSTRNSSKLK